MLIMDRDRKEEERKKEKKRLHDERHWCMYSDANTLASGDYICALTNCDSVTKMGGMRVCVCCIAAEKPLDEMTDRDWRIFKEDFNITTKGGKVPHPWRSWDEANLPKALRKVIEDLGYDVCNPTRQPPSLLRDHWLPRRVRIRLNGVAYGNSWPLITYSNPRRFKGKRCRSVCSTETSSVLPKLVRAASSQAHVHVEIFRHRSYRCAGSGKTAAFLIPMLVWMLNLPRASLESSENEGPYAIILAPTREVCGAACVALNGGCDALQSSLRILLDEGPCAFPHCRCSHG